MRHILHIFYLGNIYRMTAFTDHVKKIAAEQKISYREAMKLAKETYIKPIKVEKSSSEEESVSPVVEDVKPAEEVKVETPLVIECKVEMPVKKPRKKKTVVIP